MRDIFFGFLVGLLVIFLWTVAVIEPLNDNLVEEKQHDQEIVDSYIKKISSKYPGYKVECIKMATLSNGLKSHEFALVKEGKLVAHVYVHLESGEITTEFVK
jgi:hypothetical protein